VSRRDASVRFAPLLVLLLLASACRRPPELADLDLFAAANATLLRATTPEECRAAAARYEDLLARGGENGAVLHGLGNAWFRAGDRGRAVAAYRRASRLRPRDPWLAANLAQAQAGLPAAAPPLLDAFLPWRDDLSPREQAWGFTGSVGLACLTLVLLRFVPRARAALRPVAWLAAATCLLTVITFGRTVFEMVGTRHAAIAGTPEEGGVVVRKGDGESFAPALTEPVRSGTECLVLDRRGGFAQVELPGGHVGWVDEQRLAEW
jgi:hypothetical protein